MKNKEEILGTSNLDTSSLTGISVNSSRISKHLNSVSPSKKRLNQTQERIDEENEDETFIPPKPKYVKKKAEKLQSYAQP